MYVITNILGCALIQLPEIIMLMYECAKKRNSNKIIFKLNSAHPSILTSQKMKSKAHKLNQSNSDELSSFDAIKANKEDLETIKVSLHAINRRIDGIESNLDSSVSTHIIQIRQDSIINKPV